MRPVKVRHPAIRLLAVVPAVCALWYLGTLEVRQRFPVLFFAAWFCFAVVIVSIIAQWIILVLGKARRD